VRWAWLRPVVLEAFRERDVGVFDGLTQSEVKARYPAQVALGGNHGPDALAAATASLEESIRDALTSRD
jgi:broad specificity phosphatase PhoE